MNNSITIFVTVAILIIVAAWYFDLGGLLTERNNMIKNVDLMKNGSAGQYEVIKENVIYFEDKTGLFVYPSESGDFPGVVMIHENRGLRPEIREAAEMLAKEGYMVLAVDLLGGIAEDQDGARALTSNFNPEKGVENMRAAASYLRQKGAVKMASLGWCFGGRQSVELAISGEKLDATVVYYGGGMATTEDSLRPITWPVLGIFGDQDRAIPVETVREFETSLSNLKVSNEIHVYPGVGHAFANPSGANYAPNETADAWAKTLTFLKENLKNN